MRTIKILHTLIFLLMIGAASVPVNGQEAVDQTTLPQAAVLNVDAAGLVDDPTMLGNLLRLELQKLKRYQVMDKYDMADLLSGSEIDVMDCYSTRCLLEAGKILGVDKMITGNAEKFLDKIIITIKIVDVQSDRVEAAEVGEYLNMSDELQNMLKLALNDLLNIPNDPMLTANLAYYDVLSPPRSSRITNNGPRVGFAYIGGDLGDRLSAPTSKGGYDVIPFISQLGVQYEVQYMSAGNFQALLEGIALIGGLEQSRFVPSVSILNGFRENKYGFEFGFGPSVSLRNVATGYYDLRSEGDGEWHLANEWNTELLGPNPNQLKEEVDSRGEREVYTRWIWSFGKTFRSGHLNIPVNLYGSVLKNDWQLGLSVGFNIQRSRRTK